MVLNIICSFIMWCFLGTLIYNETKLQESQYDPLNLPLIVKIERLGYAVVFMILVIRIGSLFAILDKMNQGKSEEYDLNQYWYPIIVLFGVATIATTILSLYMIER